jgi:hypothetical protein
MTARIVAALAVVVAVAAAASAAEGAKKKKRTIAVLEYRAGATGAPDLGMRLALILRNETSNEILDPDDARRIGGAKVDETVARCGGEPTCIAEIGRKIGADEIVLVGVSEFGDLILALQLVEARGGRVVARVADSLAPDAEPDDDTLLGYLKKILPPADFLRFGVIRVSTNVEGALVEMNGKPAGETPLDPLTVAAPTTVSLRVSKDGYVDFNARIDVLPEGTVEVNPVLERRAGPAWYQRWWVWAAAGTLLVGAVTVGVILAQPEPSSVPVFIDF